MEGLIGFIIAILMIIAQIIKSIKESANAAKQQNVETNDDYDEELVIIAQPKTVKQAKKVNKQRSSTRQSLGGGLSILDNKPKSGKRQALSKNLSPQGEGQRFDAAPGTLDTAHIVAPTFDSTVKPELDSITGIYEEGAVYTEQSKSAITLNIADCFTKPEGIIQAVILTEILNRPAWKSETTPSKLTERWV